MARCPVKLTEWLACFDWRPSNWTNESINKERFFELERKFIHFSDLCVSRFLTLPASPVTALLALLVARGPRDL